jgi:hypothetical protein
MRKLFGFALIIHGLAHASAGVWATDMAHPFIVTLLWEGAAVGFIVAGGMILGLVPLERYLKAVSTIAISCSLVLLLLFAHSVFVPGALIDVALAVLLLFRTQPAAMQSTRPRVGRMLFAAFTVYTAVVIGARYTTLIWGTTPYERTIPLPGDPPSDDQHYRIDHAVTIEAPADSVWKWLAQIGQDRAGFYSYDWLERAAGDDIHNVDSIVPAWQQVDPGDLVRAIQPGYLGGVLDDKPGWRVKEVVPGRAMVLEGWGAFVLRPTGEKRTRMHIRTRGAGTPKLSMIPIAPVSLLVFEPAHFIMERGMLLGIKKRAERRQNSA